MPPIMGWQALAWKIAHYPKIWIPFICIVIAVVVVVYFVFASAAAGPLPDPSKVKGLYISWGAPGDESSFRQLDKDYLYPEFRNSLMGSWASLKTAPEDMLIATVRVDTTDGKSIYAKLYDPNLMVIDGEVYDNTKHMIFLQQVGEPEYGSPYGGGRGY
jgi:hypothetical protein